MQRFLDAGLEVFSQFGYQASSIEQICERASMSRGAFYSNFSDKETLFLELFDRHADRMLAQTAAAVDAESTIEGVVRSLFGGGTETKQDERQWFLLSAEFSIQASRNPVAAQRLADHDRAVVEKLSKILSSTLCSVDEEDPKIQLLARLTLAIYEGGMMQMVADPTSFAPLELLEYALPTLAREWTGQVDDNAPQAQSNFR